MSYVCGCERGVPILLERRVCATAAGIRECLLEWPGAREECLGVG